MQLKRFSVLVSAFLAASSLCGDDYVRVQFMGYDEDSGRTTIYSPSVEISKDFGVDYSFRLSFSHDSVSGASPTFYDTQSGASATLPEGVVYKHTVKYGDIEYEDKRKAVSLLGTKRFESRDELTLGMNYSDEYDYTSKEISAEYLHYLDESKNRSISFAASYQKNDVSVYCSLGNRECDGITGASERIMDLDVISVQLGFTRIVNRKSLLKTSVFYINEEGYLSNPYMRVVRDYNSGNVRITQEDKPGSRKAYGVMFEYFRSLNEKISLNAGYRFYNDDWKIASHTASAELFYELNDRVTLGTAVRLYTQSAAKFYSERKDYFTDQKYASSDRRMSDFEDMNIRLSADYRLNKKITLNTNLSYYNQFDLLDAVYYGVGIKYDF